MKIIIFDAHAFELQSFEKANRGRHQLHFLDVRLNERTAALAKGYDAVCCFANDKVDEKTLVQLKDFGIQILATRSAGYNHIDIKKAKQLGIPVVRVPEYSPYAVAEHAVALLLSLNRKIHRANNRVREMNFSLDGLVGFDLHGKTVGVIGTGRIGKVFCEIMRGFGCKVLAHDLEPDTEWAKKNQIHYSRLDEIFSSSRIISLHLPLTEQSLHLINQKNLELMQKDVILINTGRGGLIDSQALLVALKSHQIAGACLDVYEEESGIFFNDLSAAGIDDDVLARLLTFPNVLMTSHQGFLTQEALDNITSTTLKSLSLFEEKKDLGIFQIN